MILLGVTVSVVTPIIIKGGGNVSTSHDDTTKTNISLPLIDTLLPSKTETATFALG